MEILSKGTILKSGFSLQKIISWSAFSVGRCIAFIILIQVTELQRGMEIHIHPCIQHPVGGFPPSTSSFGIAEVSFSSPTIEGAWVQSII